MLTRILYRENRYAAMAVAVAASCARYALANRFSHAPLAPEGAAPVIVSLTSFPARIRTAYLAIESLFSQSLRPAKVVLWLSTEEMEGTDIPASLRRLCRRGLEIRMVSSRLRSHNKLYFAAGEYKDSVIVTADDDIFYPRWWLEKLYGAHRQNPAEILCYRAHILRKSGGGSDLFIPYHAMHCADSVGNFPPSFALLPTGVSGVLYPPGIFDGEFFDKEKFLALCANCDDIWYRLMSIRAGVKAARVFPYNLHFLPVPPLHRHALSPQNIYGGNNDISLTRAFSAYPEAYAKLEDW